MTGGSSSAAIEGGLTVPPPGWARWSDHIRARLFARSIDDKLLNGAVPNGNAVVLVRRARLVNPRYRSKVAAALRKVLASARRHHRSRFIARIPLLEGEVLRSEPLIMTLADELEEEESVSPRGVILAERLVTDGDSPVYWSGNPNPTGVETVDSAVRHARAALHEQVHRFGDRLIRAHDRRMRSHDVLDDNV